MSIFIDQKNMPSQGNKEYIDSVRLKARNHGREDIAKALSQPCRNITKLHFVSRNEYRSYDSSSKRIVEFADKNLQAGGPAVCIVENISPDDIGVLGSAWGLEPEFFMNHASNPPRKPMESIRFVDGYSQVYGEQKKPYDHIDAWFEYNGIPLQSPANMHSAPNYFERHCFQKERGDEPKMVSITRISYYRVERDRVGGDLYLFLVDSPIHHLQHQYRYLPRRFRPILKVPYADNLGGLILPQYLKYDDESKLNHYSILEALTRVFIYRWQRQILFNHKGDQSQAFPGPPLCCMISSSLYQENLKYLRKEIKRISFEEIKDPKFKTNDTLHNRREDLVGFLIGGLYKTKTRMQESITKFWHELQEQNKIIVQDGAGRDPVIAHKEILERAQELERCLMETFQLYMSTTSAKEALRVTQLTTLTLIFLPLSFVTGVFGMNFKELNGSVLSISVFGIVVAPIIIAEAFAVWYMIRNENEK